MSGEKGFLRTQHRHVGVNNPNGTAPSFVVEDPRGIVFALPGVPFELKWLFDNEVVPYLRKRF